MRGLADDELADLGVAAHVHASAGLAGGDPLRVQAEDRPQPRLGLALAAPPRSRPDAARARSRRDRAGGSPARSGQTVELPCQESSDESSRGPSIARRRAVSHAAAHAHAARCAHHVGAGGGAAGTATHGHREADRRRKDQRPVAARQRRRRPSHARASLAACDRAFGSAQPIAHRHASIGAGPTRASQRKPSRLAGPSYRHPHALSDSAPDHRPSLAGLLLLLFLLSSQHLLPSALAWLEWLRPRRPA